MWDFSISKIALRKQKFAKAVDARDFSYTLKLLSFSHPNPSTSCLLPAHNKPNLFTAHRKQTGLSAGLEIINLINSPAAKPLGELVFLSNCFILVASLPLLPPGRCKAGLFLCSSFSLALSGLAPVFPSSSPLQLPDLVLPLYCLSDYLTVPIISKSSLPGYISSFTQISSIKTRHP